MNPPPARPAGPRPPRRRTHTRARLLAAASELFLTVGFARTSIEDVCAAAGYTRGAFYSNFGSKEDLLLALFDEQAAGRMAELERLAAACEALAPQERARRLVEALLRVEPEEAGWILLFLEFRLLAARTAGLADRVAAHDRTVSGALAAVLERALPELVPPGASAAQAAAVILAAREGLLARTAAGGEVAEELLAATAAVLGGMLG
ncbi:helix-turn-helix domain-containing protein [Kitasatospora sp. CM 4170]|uniref:TetR/AcrR family transcriptional regulator n=1 Tax=Kitasatospora aburaviensis TaxID=67265 RepID=A0ABW1FB76_9ACTN|nr:helix-turn-helix domain-containing protein [Kitasatospora sp. CM 4170]WNM48884.1 helix-turn-helix domain-containing protein [Kitasatospora sp. CM 4170]